MVCALLYVAEEQTAAAAHLPTHSPRTYHPPTCTVQLAFHPAATQTCLRSAFRAATRLLNMLAHSIRALTDFSKRTPPT